MAVALHRMMGVDLTAIPTVGVNTALVIAAEIGPDFSAFPSAQHFSSWLGLAPGTRISGGKSLPGRGPKVVNRVGQALRMAAVSARTSQTFIGAKHRSRLARMDTSVAVVATARELACLIYLMVTRGQQYAEKGMEVYESRRLDRKFSSLRRQAKKLGFQLVESRRRQQKHNCRYVSGLETSYSREQFRIRELRHQYKDAHASPPPPLPSRHGRISRTLPVSYRGVAQHRGDHDCLG